MHQFYNRALLILAGLLTASLLLGYACVRLSYTHVALLPPTNSIYPSEARASSDAELGGKSSARLVANGATLGLEFSVAPGFGSPFAAAELWFVDGHGRQALVDLSRYATISFRTRCAPPHTMTMTIPTFDPKISRREQVLTYRTLWAFFPCDQDAGRIELDLTRLETPQWWYDLFKFDLLRHGYVLDQVPKIAFGSAPGTLPRGQSHFEISNIELNGRDYRYLVLLGIFELSLWSGFGTWLFLAHSRALTANVNARLRTDLPLVEYQQLTIEPHRDREKAGILHFIASNYANPDIDIEAVAVNTATNRAKINEVLKAAFGYTFTAYVNKLRLTEAARLLTQNATATIAEIAYTVGYANVSYFNKLFKEEYGCTPKAFRNGSAPGTANDE